MARYGSALEDGALSLTLAVAALVNPGSGPRRLKISDIIFSSPASPPADNVIQWRIQRSTTAPTATAVTPEPLASADPVAVGLASENATANGTLTANAIPLEVVTNGRATFRWVAAEGSEIVIPATINNGIHILTPVASNLPPGLVTIIHEE